MFINPWLDAVQAIFDAMASRNERHHSRLSFHQTCQRALILGASRPRSAHDDFTHPFFQLLSEHLESPLPPNAPPELQENHSRFAVHLGLALVALGAIPSDPGARPYSVDSCRPYLPVEDRWPVFTPHGFRG